MNDFPTGKQVDALQHFMGKLKGIRDPNALKVYTEEAARQAFWRHKVQPPEVTVKVVEDETDEGRALTAKLKLTPYSEEARRALMDEGIAPEFSIWIP